ncbi:MAG: PDC sensor domain-containing protein, partial [Bacteroidia bacterium]
MKKTLPLLTALVICSLILLISSCKEEETPPPSPTAEQKIETALDAFVADLVTTPPTAMDISDRVKNYLSLQPVSFFGSTVTLLDSASKATYSPYWYRLNDTLAYKNLADTAYHIDEQSWLRRPIDEQKSVWTD